MSHEAQGPYHLDRVPSEVIAAKMKRRRPESKDRAGTMVYVVKVQLDLYSGACIEKADAIFPGLTAKAKAIAADEGKGETGVAHQKLGLVAFTLYDGEGVALIADGEARGGIPRFIIGERAVTTHLVVDIEIDVPRAKVGLVHDYFQADSVIGLKGSWASPAKPAPKKDKAPATDSRQVEAFAVGNGVSGGAHADDDVGEDHGDKVVS